MRLLNWMFHFLGLRLIKKSSRTLELPWAVMVLAKAAEPLVALEDPKELSGEYKRHQVYARMLKQFPEVDRDDVGFALEIAVRQMKGKL